ncbi:16004_t:CDS:10 [Entrophospora sp. SA101]|nr:16004_t:CDS:10 [Entrophospora sp. SA101]CAJ0834176.1 17697_t:CDS:10 [Entrophospora sp. SA101]
MSSELKSSSTSKDYRQIPDVPLVSVSNTYFEDLILTTRSRPIPWEGYQSAGIITSEEFELLKRVDKQSREQLRTVMKTDAANYAELYANLLKKVAKSDTVQYTLVLINDMLSDDEQNAQHFHALSNKDDPNHPYQIFTKLLSSDDEFSQLISAKVLTVLICTAQKNLPINFRDFFNWIILRLKSNNTEVYELAVQILESILRVPANRIKFWNIQQGVETLATLLKVRNPSLQMQYQIIFCFWLLTFNKEVAEDFNKKFDLIPTLINIAKSAIKEKIIRVIIGTFRNLVEKAPESNLPTMLVAKLLNFCENLSGRKWSDSEIVEDIEFLRVRLQENFYSLTTFDEYASEISSGMLHWSPPHESEQFWKQNVARLNERDHELIRILARLLSTSNDHTVLAVAAHDLGQYVKHYPSGKKFLQEIGAKQRIMELMTYEDSEVRYQALLAVQKYMTHAWIF